MSSITCDNAECVLYVDKLMGEFPHQFELEFSTRVIGGVEAGEGERLAGNLTRTDRSARPRSGPAPRRRRTTRQAERPPSATGRQDSASRIRVNVDQARCRTAMTWRVLEWHIGKQVRALMQAEGITRVYRSTAGH